MIDLNKLSAKQRKRCDVWVAETQMFQRIAQVPVDSNAKLEVVWISDNILAKVKRDKT